MALPATHRAFQLLTVKSIDDEARTFSGVASTPTPDSDGDIVEPLGVSVLKSPTPLLLFHDQRQPVGFVYFDPPSSAGITFRAQMPRIAEEGTLKTRVDEAWTSVKYRLLAAVSIGFRPKDLTDKSIKSLPSGGYRFLQTVIHELSLCVLPANHDAAITSVAAVKAFVKSLDRTSAASGSGAPIHLEPPAGITALAPRTRREPTMNISDKIVGLRDERKGVAEKMTAIMKPVVEATGDLTAEQQTEYNGLKKELSSIDRDLDNFLALEQAEMAVAAPIVKGDGSRVFGVSRVGSPREPELPPGIEYTRYLICQMAAKMFGVSALDVAKERYPNTPRIQAILKTGIAGGTTTDATWAAPLLATPQTLVAEFLNYLRPMTIIGQFGVNGIPPLTSIPFNVRIQSESSGGGAGWVGQGKAKPVHKYDYTAVTLYWAKVASICVLADELIRFSNPSAEARVRDQLARTIQERLDIDFIDPNKIAVANVSPASITNSLTGLHPTASGSSSDVRADIGQMVGAFVAANADIRDLVWIMPTEIALELSLMRNALGNREFPEITVRGGMFEGYPVITSQYAADRQSPTGNVVILVKASEIFLADDGGLSIDASNQASIEMSDDPENDSGTVVSMYQTNQVALRAERYINWAKARATGSVVRMDNVAWSATAGS